MLGHRQLGVEDYTAILRRRMWWIIVPAILGPIITFGISLKLQNRYTSQTLVLVERQKVPEGYVKPVVTELINARLATMQEQILSRSRLQPIIDRFGLFSDKPISVEEKVELMRKAVNVSAVRGDFGGETGGLPGFYVSFTAPNARLAQQVCAEITSMFISENLNIREQSAQGTTDFLKSQLEDAKRNLDEQDAKLAQFKQKYIGQLPGQEQNNLSMLTTLNTQLEAATQGLNKLQQDRTFAESMLTQQLQAWHTMKASQANGAPAVSSDFLQQQLVVAQAELDTLKNRYTDTHPDVIKARQKVDSLRKRIDAAALESAKTPVNDAKPIGPEPGGIQQLRANMKALDGAIADKRAEQASIQKAIQTYQARVQSSPVVEEQAKKLTRDYETALQFYNSLLNKKNESEMATDLEKRQQGEQFRVLDAANLPEKPTFPNRPLFAGGGFIGGLALGLGIALLFEFRDKSLRTEQDVQFFLELPTLALLPILDTPQAAEDKKRGFWKRKKTGAEDRELVGA